MPTTINKTDGTVLVTLVDGTVNSSVSGLTLVGSLYRNYGELINENLVKLLENFSNSSAPTLPLVGQLWYDTSDKKIKIYRNTGFVPLGVTVVSSNEPSSPAAGDLWWDTADRQLKIYNGTVWISLAPGYSTSQGISGAVVENIQDTTTTQHVLTKVYQSGTVIATISKDSEYTPSLPIDGFATIGPGIQLSTAINGATFRGNVNSAQTLDGISSAQFLRSDTSDTINGTLTVANDGGITIGADNDLTLSVSGANTLISNSTTDGDIVFRVNRSGSGTTSALTINGNNGSLQLLGNIIPAVNNAFNIGSASLKFANVYANTFNGTAIEALYADLAEKYTVEKEWPVGTAMTVSDSLEFESEPARAGNHCIGVISNNPAYLMNAESGGQAIALKGRVPVRVMGTVKKGQAVYAYSNGVCSTVETVALVGVALESNYNTVEKLVECVLKV